MSLAFAKFYLISIVTGTTRKNGSPPHKTKKNIEFPTLTRREEKTWGNEKKFYKGEEDRAKQLCWCIRKQEEINKSQK
jgi:hypothetical protein